MTPFHLSFKNQHTVYEKTVKCTVKSNEYNLSYNPSLLVSGSQENLVGFATGSAFYPFVTTVGLYDNEQNLLAVAKFGQPIPMSAATDYNFILKLDM